MLKFLHDRTQRQWLLFTIYVLVTTIMLVRDLQRGAYVVGVLFALFNTICFGVGIYVGRRK